MSSVEVRYPSQARLELTLRAMVRHIEHEMERRSYLAANELRNASLLVLRGQRNGRRYKVPGTHRRQRDKATGKMRNGVYYTASAPGEPPAVRTGVFRMSWQPSAHTVFGQYISRIESEVKTDNGKYNLGEILEKGTRKMAPRPHHEKILEQAQKPIEKIYAAPYF